MEKSRLLLSEVEIEVPFHDVDSIQMVWHGNHVKYFEIARTALLRRIDYDIAEMMESGVGYPVIELKCRYVQPIRYGMWIKVAAWVAETDHRLKINYQITERDSGQRLAKGHTVQAALEVESGKLIEPVELQRRIQVYLEAQ